MDEPIEIPSFCLALVIGASPAARYAFIRRNFSPGEIVSPDACRQLAGEEAIGGDISISGDEASDSADLLQRVVAMRLRRGRLTAVDAGDLSSEERRALLRIAKKHYTPAIAIVLDSANEREHTPDRPQAAPAEAQFDGSQNPAAALHGEGFQAVWPLRSAETAAASVARRPPAGDHRHDHGPFDAIGDVHGCLDELEELLGKLGYQKIAGDGETWGLYPWRFHHPEGRKALFVGDLVDRGPHILKTCELVRNMVEAGEALAVVGNHDDKLLRYLKGRPVKIAHGLENSLAELEALPPEKAPAYRPRLIQFFDSLPSHTVLAGGDLVLAHAGIKAAMIGRETPRVRDFTLYGETHGESDEFGLPVRYNWAARYRGPAAVVYGHTPMLEAEWLNRTINIDTGCVFGGKLTALRYPETVLVSVAARATYAAPRRPIGSGVSDYPDAQA